MSSLLPKSAVVAAVIAAVISCDSTTRASILPNVPSGGWTQTQPGSGNFDDFDNVLAALTAASLNTAGLQLVTGIDDPATTGNGLGANFTITGQGTTSGSWILDQNDLQLDSDKTLAYFSLKANGHWNLWQVMADTDASSATFTNLWDTNSSGGGLLTPNLDNFAALSHIRFWAINDPLGPPPGVPEFPSVAVWSLIVGLSAVFTSRKK